MIQESTTPHIPQQYQHKQLRTEFITEPLKTYPIQINTLSSSPTPQRILLIKSSATSPVITQLVALPRKQTKTQTRIIRVPFLPRSEPLAVLVKQSTPTENGSVETSNQDTEFLETKNCSYPQANINYRNLTESISSNTCNYNSNLIGSDQHNQNQNCYQALNLNQTQNKNQIQIIKNQELPPRKSMTLASMAGIQLTSADESHTMEMSGAMQPTATVEEINVPVFIDEYLQQPTQTSSTTRKTTLEEDAASAAIINSNSNFNQYNCGTNDNNNNNYNGNGNIYLENDTFEDLDFDIEMIAEDTNDMMTMTIGEEMENNSNNNNTDFYYYTNDGSSTSNNNTYKNNNNNIGFITELEPKVEPQFHTSPGMEHDFLSEDITIYSLEQEMGTDNILSNEEAVDISHFNNDNYSLFPDAMCSSQNDPMFTVGLSQKLSQELQKSEPVIEPDINYDAEYELYTKRAMQQTSQTPEVAIAEQAIEEEKLDSKLIIFKEEPKSPVAQRPKRKQQPFAMQEKKRKLHLNTKLHMTSTMPTLNTPDLVNLLVDQQPHTAPFFEDVTIDDIMNVLLDNSHSNDVSPLDANADTTCWTAIVDSSDDTTNQNISTSNFSAEAAIDDQSYDSYGVIYNDAEDPPYTPSTSTSATIRTRLTISSSPNSPALSTNSAATTSSALVQQKKKKRGRPSKEHSDKPDPAQLVQLSEAERKRLEDRAKNNEASRLSRLKNKQREEIEIEEQEQLMQQNLKMKAELEYLERVTKKLKRALHRRQMLHQR